MADSLLVPDALWNYVINAYDNAGLSCETLIIAGEGGRPVPALAISLMLVPNGDGSDSVHNSGMLSDRDVALGEEAFRAGHRAATKGVSENKAWDDFEPSEDVINFPLTNNEE